MPPLRGLSLGMKVYMRLLGQAKPRPQASMYVKYFKEISQSDLLSYLSLKLELYLELLEY